MRLEGWESRLNKLIEWARHKPYKLGEHDCFRMACKDIEALTGIDRWQEWEGRYSTEREAVALIHSYGHNFTEAASRFFGSEPVPVSSASRGDIMEYRDAKCRPHLVVCVGRECVGLLEPAGLTFVEIGSCRHAWRVG